MAGDRAWHQAHHDQSTSSPSTAVAHDGHGASRVVDVGGRGSRTRTNLKNPSTTLPAESSPLQVHQRTRGPTTDGAARKWSAVLCTRSPFTYCRKSYTIRKKRFVDVRVPVDASPAPPRHMAEPGHHAGHALHRARLERARQARPASEHMAFGPSTPNECTIDGLFRLRRSNGS